jgi:hypothetical protein
VRLGTAAVVRLKSALRHGRTPQSVVTAPGVTRCGLERNAVALQVCDLTHRWLHSRVHGTDCSAVRSNRVRPEPAEPAAARGRCAATRPPPLSARAAAVRFPPGHPFGAHPGSPNAAPAVPRGLPVRSGAATRSARISRQSGCLSTVRAQSVHKPVRFRRPVTT